MYWIISAIVLPNELWVVSEEKRIACSHNKSGTDLMLVLWGNLHRFTDIFILNSFLEEVYLRYVDIEIISENNVNSGKKIYLDLFVNNLSVSSISLHIKPFFFHLDEWKIFNPPSSQGKCPPRGKNHKNNRNSLHVELFLENKKLTSWATTSVNGFTSLHKWNIAYSVMDRLASYGNLNWSTNIFMANLFKTYFFKKRY